MVGFISPGMDRKLLEMSLEKASSILTQLDNQDPAAVAEYVKTVHSVDTVLRRLLVTKKLVKVDVKALDNIHVILTEYETRIYARKGADGLKKALESSRTRKRIDQINASLFAYLRQFLAQLKDLNASRASVGGASTKRPHRKKKRGGEGTDCKPTKKRGGSRTLAEESSRAGSSMNVEGKATKVKTKGKLEGKGSSKKKRNTVKTGEESREAKKKRSGHSQGKKAKTKASGKKKAGTDDTKEKDKGEKKGKTVKTPSDDASGVVGDNSAVPPAAVMNVDLSSSSTSESSESSEEGEAVGMSMFDIGSAGDSSADPWWNETFNTYLVAFDDLLRALAKEIGVAAIDPEDAELLRSVVDDSNTGHVPGTNWGEFLKAFGPLEKVFDNVKSVLSAPWFHKYLSGVEAERILADKDVGTFLIRFSKSSAGNFALAFVHAPKVVVQILISSSPEGGFLVLQQETGEYKHFDTLWDIVDFYQMFLRTPLTDDLFRQPWFHGDLSSDEAGEALKFEVPGVFLIRWSSRPSCYACSYVDDDGTVHHSLIEQQGGGRVKFSNNLEVFESMEALLKAYDNILQSPYQSKSLGIEDISRMKVSQSEKGE